MLIGSLGLFLYGMKIMSEGLQKVAGDRLRSILTAMTTNRVTGGTHRIDDYGTDTVILCHNGHGSKLCECRLAYADAIHQCNNGANIGTTVTAWLFHCLVLKSMFQLLHFLY